MNYYWFLSSFVANAAFTLQLYSDGLCATNILCGTAIELADGGQRFHSLVCFEMSPKVQPLIKNAQIFPRWLSTKLGLVLYLRHLHTLPPISVPSPFFLQYFIPGLITAHAYQPTIYWFHPSFPIEMMSDLYISRLLVAPWWQKQTLKHLLRSSWHHQSVVILPAHTHFPDSHRLKLIFSNFTSGTRVETRCESRSKSSLFSSLALD